MISISFCRYQQKSELHVNELTNNQLGVRSFNETIIFVLHNFFWIKSSTISTLSGARWSLGVIMVPIRDSIDQECYLVTKHSWKGKYKRILAIGKTGISTYNPEKLDVTNRWPYSDVVAIAPNKSLQNVSTSICFERHFVSSAIDFVRTIIDTRFYSSRLFFYLSSYECAVKPWVFINIKKRPEIWYHQTVIGVSQRYTYVIV